MLDFHSFISLLKAAEISLDNSTSMTWDGECIPALQSTLLRVARFATILEPKGISVRFLNYSEGITGEFDNLTNPKEVQKVIMKVPFTGDTRLGEVLGSKIVQPMIIQKAAEKTLEKPVFVVIITDGEVSRHGFLWTVQRLVILPCAIMH